MGWGVNYQDGTYDPTKINFYPAPNDDYLEAAKFYASGQKVTLKLIKNGVLTGKDTTLACTGVSTWFPGDLNAIQQKGGLGVIASTKDFGGQMGAALVMISKWVEDNKEAAINLIAAIGLGGDQVKSHMASLEYSAKAGKEVFASSMSEEDIVKAYSSYDVVDDDGETINVGGSRVFNLSDAANYTGVVGGQDKYKLVYNTFGNILTEAYPEIFTTYSAYEESTDWTYLRAAYNKYKAKAGNISKVDFKDATKTNEVVGNTSYSIEFTTGSANIKPSSYSILDKVYAQLNIGDNLFVNIAGHTDNSGSDEVNIPLSKQRANAVLQYFLSKDPTLSDRLDSDGYGSTRPILNNNTELERSKNRRVEIKLFRSK
jgi:outer membrane protein OmpA-like peptidoglycan-associated protein